MQTERLGVALQPRPPWEAVDVGLRMVQAWWRPMVGAWLAVFVPLVVVLTGLLWRHPCVAIAILWWLKPLLERIPLYVASEALFGHVPGVRETLRALPRVMRVHALRALTVYRLAPARSFTLPVVVLEGLRGQAQSERIRTLRWQSGGVPTLLTVVCVHVEQLVLCGGLTALAVIFLPESASLELEDLLPWGGAGVHALEIAQLGVEAVAISIMAPFYTVAGFSLYLHRRVYLEGWDIDLVFRGLSRRVAPAGAAPGAGPRPAGALLLAGLALSLLLAPGAARAELRDPAEAPATLERVMQEPELRGTREIRTWVRRDRARGGEPETCREILDWLEGERDAEAGGTRLSTLLGQIGRVGIWLGIALLAWWILRQAAALPRAGPAPSAPPPPGQIAGMDIRPDSLPDDAVREARALFAAGRPRGALALLYRAALSYLVHQRGLDVGPGATEGECLRRASALADVREDLTRLTRAWQSVAYARGELVAGTFDELCTRWRRHLDDAQASEGA